MSRLQVAKTYKIFIDGQFPRTESGRHYQLLDDKGRLLANLCLSSKKDVRNAAVAARKAFAGWSTRTGYNRSQILYRLAEMLETRSQQFVDELVFQGMKKSIAEKDVVSAIDRVVYYAGWCDKYSQLFSSVNAVTSPHFNFSMPEPMGVVAVFSAGNDALNGIVSMLAPALAGGNTCIYLAASKYPLTAVTFAEALATCDLPAGVVNILTGSSEELLPHLSAHMDINALVYGGNNKSESRAMQQNCSLNVKRFFEWSQPRENASAQGPYFIMDLQEIKTTWHPVENIGSSGGSY